MTGATPYRPEVDQDEPGLPDLSVERRVGQGDWTGPLGRHDRRVGGPGEELLQLAGSDCGELRIVHGNDHAGGAIKVYGLDLRRDLRDLSELLRHRAEEAHLAPDEGDFSLAERARVERHDENRFVDRDALI